MKLSKQIWIAMDYAVTFCPELSGKKLKRQNRLKKFKQRKELWSFFYDEKTRKRIWDCNPSFTERHFYKVQI